MLIESYVLSFILVLLFLTDFLPEYLRLFGFGRIKKLYLNEYFKERATTLTYFPENYLEYLNTKCPNFFTSLSSCGFCLGFWLSCILEWFNVLQITQIYIQGLLLFFGIKYLSKQSVK